MDLSTMPTADLRRLRDEVVAELARREAEVAPFKVGDLVRHRRRPDYYGVGEVIAIAQSGLRVRVWWPRRGGITGFDAYYTLAVLEHASP